jgi:hypothetical protein
MNEMLNLCRGALTLDTKVFSDLRASPNVFRKGFMLILAVGLIVGLVLGLAGMVQGLLSNPAGDVAQARAAAEESMRTFMQDMPPEASQAFFDSYLMGFRIAERIVTETKAPLPHPVPVLLKQIGVVVSQPFSWLGSLLFYGALVHIFAKLLGGRATIAQMLGVTSLTVMPHLLDAFGFIPCLGGLLGLVAWVWGAVIYVKGTAAAQEMTIGRALFAFLLPILVGIFLAVLLIILFVVLIAAASGGQ